MAKISLTLSGVHFLAESGDAVMGLQSVCATVVVGLSHWVFSFLILPALGLADWGLLSLCLSFLLFLLTLGLLLQDLIIQGLRDFLSFCCCGVMLRFLDSWSREEFTLGLPLFFRMAWMTSMTS